MLTFNIFSYCASMAKHAAHHIGLGEMMVSILCPNKTLKVLLAAVMSDARRIVSLTRFGSNPSPSQSQVDALRVTSQGYQKLYLIYNPSRLNQSSGEC